MLLKIPRTVRDTLTGRTQEGEANVARLPLDGKVSLMVCTMPPGVISEYFLHSPCVNSLNSHTSNLALCPLRIPMERQNDGQLSSKWVNSITSVSLFSIIKYILLSCRLVVRHHTWALAPSLPCGHSFLISLLLSSQDCQLINRLLIMYFTTTTRVLL